MYHPDTPEASEIFNIFHPFNMLDFLRVQLLGSFGLMSVLAMIESQKASNVHQTLKTCRRWLNRVYGNIFICGVTEYIRCGKEGCRCLVAYSCNT